jgi:hypothetical protein
MSVSVPLNELAQQIERFGRHPYLVTVATDGRPRAASVSVSWQRGALVVDAGRRSTENVGANAAVALLWPASRAGDHALIVDGRGVAGDGPPATRVIVVEPSTAVLHVTSSDRAA